MGSPKISQASEIHCGPLIYISLLFSAMLTHGVAPGGLLLSKLVGIPKNKRGNKSDSIDYQAIAISSLRGKIFHLIVLTEQCIKPLIVLFL